MSTSVTLPALGESVTEGTVSRWLKQVGDTVEADEPLLEVSTDKVDTEIPSPTSGVLLEIRAQEDETVEVGAVLARNRRTERGSRKRFAVHRGSGGGSGPGRRISTRRNSTARRGSTRRGSTRRGGPRRRDNEGRRPRPPNPHPSQRLLPIEARTVELALPR